jgi:hypothetical protein
MVMIQANELRIGNWVKHRKTGKLKQVLEIYTSRINIATEPPLMNKQISVPLTHYEPIPLTPEIFKKCGFEFIKGMPSYMLVLESRSYEFATLTRTLHVFHGDNNGYSVELIEYCMPYGDDENSKNIVNVSYIQYLHQLQNIYWFLCGKELTINITYSSPPEN